MEIIRVLVVDDHAIVRRGVFEIVRELFPAAILEEANDGEAALQKCLTESWHLVILDISMPKLNGLEFLREARRHQLDLCVIILSMHIWPQHVQLAFKLGAMGFISKTEAGEELKPAIRAVLQGRTYLGREVAYRMEGQLPEEDE